MPDSSDHSQRFQELFLTITGRAQMIDEQDDPYGGRFLDESTESVTEYVSRTVKETGLKETLTDEATERDA